MTTKTKHGTRWLCTTALLMAMNIIMSMSVFSVPVPGGHLYLNDVIICFAALILDPLGAFCVGGVGAFLGDFFFYPTPMFVSLVTHGLQAVVISLCAHRMMKEKPVIASLIGVLLGAVIMVVGYSLGVHLRDARRGDRKAPLPDPAGARRRGARHGAALEGKAARKARREARRDGGIKVVFFSAIW